MFFKNKCPTCGAKNPKENMTCNSCGAPFTLGKVESQLPKVKTREELLRITSTLENYKGEVASTKDSRLSLYRSALSALIEAGGNCSYIIFELKESPDCYVQFRVVQDTPGIDCEVSSEPVSERGRGILLNRGFEAPHKSTPNYSQSYEKPQPHELAEIVEMAFRDVLECPGSYTAHVVDALYQE